MKRLVLFLFLSIIVVFSGCVKVVNNQSTNKNIAHSNNGAINDSLLYKEIMSIPKGNLTEEEKRGLIMMREEEKLARDVYKALYDKWKLPIFANIERAEQTHINAVLILMKKYGIPDVEKEDVYGKFALKEYQDLYNKLVSEGNKSIIDALKVGCLIEDMDIKDLQTWINKTNKSDIKLVYENLMKGSRNHMRAFYKQLKKYGGTYEPQYISEKEFNEIISTPIERGLKNT
ncbi:DUF2202 domain-containing protein [Methanocaldococcus sp.]